MIAGRTISALLIGAVLGAGGQTWATWDLRSARDDLAEARRAIAAGEAERAAIEAELAEAEGRAAAAGFASRQLERLRRQEQARIAEMEDLIHELQTAEGAGDPVPPLLRRVIELRR